MTRKSPLCGAAFLTLLAAFFFGAAARGGEKASTTAPWDMAQIEAVARKEGKLVIYAAPGHANRQAQEALGRRFNEKYGLTIEWTTLSAQDIGPRILAEHRTQQNVADVLMHGIGGSFIDIKGRGYLLPMLAPSTLQKGVWRLDPARASPKERDWFYINMNLRPSFFYRSFRLWSGCPQDVVVEGRQSLRRCACKPAPSATDG